MTIWQVAWCFLFYVIVYAIAFWRGKKTEERRWMRANLKVLLEICGYVEKPKGEGK